MGPPRFELGLPAPQAGRIPSYPTGPYVYVNSRLIQKVNSQKTHNLMEKYLYNYIIFILEWLKGC